jgi:hypothetical protein
MVFCIEYILYQRNNSNKHSHLPSGNPSGVSWLCIMKINWGTGIAIAIALFMAFILYFVIKVQSNSKYDNEWLSKL